ncbi:hypothetical protein NPIL_373781 [Nephila pilipes]|uniref:Uncharacterized protein n=1 Tax=Nephila pilipes TaxID=299642 RepID=A0A8X6TQ51_NEPPI|nr:hypothetical protein NPIL_373781 [Nephila pilipes]
MCPNGLGPSVTSKLLTTHREMSKSALEDVIDSLEYEITLKSVIFHNEAVTSVDLTSSVKSKQPIKLRMAIESSLTGGFLFFPPWKVSQLRERMVPMFHAQVSTKNNVLFCAIKLGPFVYKESFVEDSRHRVSLAYEESFRRDVQHALLIPYS